MDINKIFDIKLLFRIIWIIQYTEEDSYYTYYYIINTIIMYFVNSKAWKRKDKLTRVLCNQRSYSEGL